jgi:uncharacterized protein (TIGR02217 family)
MGPTFRTIVGETASGYELRDQQWELERTRFSFAHTGLYQAEHEQLEAFFIARAGRAGAFRVKHPGDYQLTASNSELVPLVDGLPAGTPGVGYGVPTYAIRRKKSYLGIITYRTVTKPTSTVKVYRAGIDATGVTDGKATLDSTTGIFTFLKDQERSVSAHTPGALHVITVASAFSPNFVAFNRVYLTGVTGTAAALLNDRSHVVSSVSGADITLTTITSALTASGGTAYFYPQPSESITALGEFDYPCRFTSDEATFDIVDKNVAEGFIWQWRGIDLIEVRGE